MMEIASPKPSVCVFFHVGAICTFIESKSTKKYFKFEWICLSTKTRKEEISSFPLHFQRFQLIFI